MVVGSSSTTSNISEKLAKIKKGFRNPIDFSVVLGSSAIIVQEA